MNKIGVIILTLCIFLPGSYTLCSDETCYQYYRNIISHDRGEIQEIFDDILVKYGDIEDDLKNMLNKLNSTMLQAEKDLNGFKRNNWDIKNRIELSNSTLHNLLNDIKEIKHILENVNATENWLHEIAAANNTANLRIRVPATTDQLLANEDDLKKWKKFLETFDETKYARNITNMPHSISDDLNMLESLLSEEYDSSCFNKFHKELKKLFSQLSDILNIDGVEGALTDLKKRAKKTKDKSKDIFDNTEDFLEKEKTFNIIHNLTNETLILAQDIDNLRNNIDRLLKNNEKIFDEKLDEIKKLHETDLEGLYKEYDIEEYQVLLNELEDVKKEIDEIGGSDSINIADIERELEQYVDELEYYTCILNDCRYRKPAEAIDSFNCRTNYN